MSDSILPVSFFPSATPKTIGQILDRVYRLTRGQFKLLTGVALLPSLVMLLLVAGLEAVIWIPMIRQFPKPLPPEQMLKYASPQILIPVIVVFTLLNLAIFSIYWAAASYAAKQGGPGRESYGERSLWRCLAANRKAPLAADAPLPLRGASGDSGRGRISAWVEQIGHGRFHNQSGHIFSNASGRPADDCGRRLRDTDGPSSLSGLPSLR